MRQNIPLGDELREIILAEVALVIAFALAFSGGIAGAVHNQSLFLSYIPIAFVAVTLNFVLHEMMHKFTAQRYGAIAGFKTSPIGLALTLVTGMLGTLFGLPGATYIYVHSFTKRENGIVSLAGPATNIVVFAIFFALLVGLNPSPTSYLYTAITFTISISLVLAAFNMLPITPLDGSKVLAWNLPLYIVVTGGLLGLLLLFGFPLIYLAYWVIIALVFSTLYRGLI
jgi:Zn-dependent protease